MSNYRINFGNGQVIGSFDNLGKCARALVEYHDDGFAFIERFTDGEWLNASYCGSKLAIGKARIALRK